MSSLSARFAALKKAVGGNREKTGFEFTFGMPREMFEHITPPNRTITRIISELEFSLKLSAANGGKYDGEIAAALDLLSDEMKNNGVITYKAADEAEKLLMPLSEEAKSYKLILCGHAHIDMNWMWSWQETVAAALAPFRTVLNLMEQYPEFCFSQSQTSVYKIVDDYDPEMAREIKKRIKEGRWECTSTAWVETDKNMPSTSSLLDHIKYTRDYLQKNWDIDPKDLEVDFSPDTFGHSAQIPEIDTFGSVKYYYHCRGGNNPYALYRYRAKSGAELLMYREQYWYNSAITPHIGVGIVDISKKCAGFKTGLIVYGVGDHGGGPTRRDVETAYELMKWPVYPTVRFGTFREFFKEAESVRDQLPVIDKELNFIFDGCYTTQSRIKRGNRGAENALYDARFYTSASTALTGKKHRYIKDNLASATQDTLFTHFHDILTGSCVQDSREHAMGLYQNVLAITNTVTQNSLREISDAVDTSMINVDEDPENVKYSQSEGAGVGFGIEHYQGVPNPERGVGRTRIFNIFNDTSLDRTEPVELTVWDWTGDMRQIAVEDWSGKPVEFAMVDGSLQHYWDHKYFRVLVYASVPAYGYTTVVLREKEVDSYPFYLGADNNTLGFVNSYVLENEHIKAVFDVHTAALTSLVDKASGSEMIKPGEFCGLVQLDTENNGDAWQIHSIIGAHPVTELTRIHYIGHGSLVRGIHFEAKVLGSTVSADVTLSKGSKALQYALTVDWKETKGEYIPDLVYRLPYAYDSNAVICDIPGGATERAPENHDIPCSQFAAVKPSNESKRAVGLAVDSKYGYRFFEGALTSTLIHTAGGPDPYPERAVHNIKVWVTVGSSCPKALEDAATALNHPLRFVPTDSHKGKLKPSGSFLTFANTAESTAVINSVEPADDGSLIVRAIEYCGDKTDVKLTFPSAPKSAEIVNLMQESCGKAKISGKSVILPLGEYRIGAVKIGF